MTFARLLTLALLVCSLSASAIAQIRSSTSSGAGTVSPNSDFTAERNPCCTALATPQESWKFTPNDSLTNQSLMNGSEMSESLLSSEDKNNSLDRLTMYDQKTFHLGLHDRSHLPRPDADAQLGSATRLNADTTCYAIRSYVVARDAKDSDSTHPAGYSTCRPSDRYQVKSADIHLESGPR
jgi:hypothetical protein